jgi:transcriptional regulator with XRE-family HTH domain
VLSKEEQDIFYKTLGKSIKEARIRKKIKQETLSKDLGFVSRISIVNIESGKQKVQLHTLLEISNILNVSISELIPHVEDVQKQMNPKFKIKINKEIPSDDSETAEKIKNFILYSKASNNKV